MPDNDKPTRILFVERHTKKVGGAVISMYELVRILDKALYQPVVLFFGPSGYAENYQALGVEIIILDDGETAPNSSSNANGQAATEQPAAPTRDIAASLSRYSRHLADAYRSAKEIYLLLRRDWPIIQQIRQIIRDNQIDVVHHNNSLISNRTSIIAAKLAGVPQFCHCRTLPSFTFIDKAISRFVDMFIFISSAVADNYRQAGLKIRNGVVIHNPIDVTRYQQAAYNPTLRAEFGVTEKDVLISNVGRLDWWKGQDYFLEAIAALKVSEPNIRALIVGERDHQDWGKQYYDKLQQMMETLALSDHVTFTGYRSDIPEIMASSDVIVHSASEPEPFGRVIVEAMAAGRPIIATKAGGVLDIINDQSDGYLVPPKDAAAISQTLQQIIRNPDQTRRIAGYAQEQAQKRFSAEAHTAQVQRVYQQILNP